MATYNNDKALLECLARYLRRLNPQPYKYIFFTNNNLDSTLELLLQWKLKRPTEIISLWFRKDAIKVLANPYAIIGLARQTLLERARHHDADYAVFIDDDVFIADTNLLERITAWNKPIVGGPYIRKFPEGNFLASKWINLTQARKKFPYRLKRKCVGFQEVLMTSAGCMCINRELLHDDRVKFYPVEMTSDTSEDFGYCLRARKYGYKTYLDCTLRLGHYIRPKIKKPWTVKHQAKDKFSKSEYHPFEYPEQKT